MHGILILNNVRQTQAFAQSDSDIYPDSIPDPDVIPNPDINSIPVGQKGTPFANLAQQRFQNQGKNTISSINKYRLFSLFDLWGRGITS